MTSYEIPELGRRGRAATATRVAAATVAVVALVAGCGSKADQTAPPLRIPDRRSYTMTITEVSQSYPPDGAHPRSPSKNFTARVDLQVPTKGVEFIEGSIIPSLDVGSPINGPVEGDHVTINALSGPLLTLETTPGELHEIDRYRGMVITFDANGRALGATLTGTADEGDAATYQANITATATFSDDVTPPEWHARAAVGFAPLALPWEKRQLVTTEPFVEQDVTLASLLPATAPSAFEVQPLTAVTLSFASPRGFELTPRDWDALVGLEAHPVTVHDWAGNASPIAHGLLLDDVGLGHPTTATWQAKADDPSVYAWGSVATSTTGCPDGSSCIAIGPFVHDWCETGTKGGVAMRLLGSGTAAVAYRVIAETDDGVDPSYNPAPTDFVKMQIVTPDGKHAQAAPTIAWPSGSHGPSYDSGWTSVSATVPGGASETGVAFSAEGLGASTGAVCNRSSSKWRLTVFVQRVSIASGT